MDDFVLNDNDFMDEINYQEYSLFMTDSIIEHFTIDARVLAACAKSDCTVELTGRILNKRVGKFKYVKYCIIRVTGPSDGAIKKCNKLIESYIPEYIHRKPYKRGNTQTTLYRGQFNPDDTPLYYQFQRTGKMMGSVKKLFQHQEDSNRPNPPMNYDPNNETTQNNYEQKRDSVENPLPNAMHGDQYITDGFSGQSYFKNSMNKTIDYSDGTGSYAHTPNDYDDYEQNFAEDVYVEQSSRNNCDLLLEDYLRKVNPDPYFPAQGDRNSRLEYQNYPFDVFNKNEEEPGLMMSPGNNQFNPPFNRIPVPMNYQDYELGGRPLANSPGYLKHYPSPKRPLSTAYHCSPKQYGYNRIQTDMSNNSNYLNDKVTNILEYEFGLESEPHDLDMDYLSDDCIEIEYSDDELVLDDISKNRKIHRLLS